MDFNDKYAHLWELIDKMYRVPKKHDQRCTSRRDDWRDLGTSLWFLWASFKVFGKSFAVVGHELKNIVVEEWRRWTGKCQKDDESKESGV